MSPNAQEYISTWLKEKQGKQEVGKEENSGDDGSSKSHKGCVMKGQMKYVIEWNAIICIANPM